MTMDNMYIFRFYDNANCISGVCLGYSEESAKKNAFNYIYNTFTDLHAPQLVIWDISKDDDFNEDYPNAIAVSY